ncbi:MAG: hypothetical protein RR192_00135 [Peptostreptococcaceae bacterium]
MPRMKREVKRTKKIIKEEQEQKTLVRRMRKFGTGRHEVRITTSENVKGKEDLIKVTLESIYDNRKGIFTMHTDSTTMDTLVNIVYGDNDEQVFFEDFVNQTVIVEVVKNGRYLNIDYFESLEINVEDEYEDEELEDGELDLEGIEFDEYE